MSATSKKVDSTAAAKATNSSWGKPSTFNMKAIGIDPRSAARPRSAQIRIGRRRRRSTQAPATSPTIRPAMSSAERSAEISSGPASRMRIAANGRAVLVISEPKMETVLADQTARKLRSRHRGVSEPAGLPSTSSGGAVLPATGSSSGGRWGSVIVAEG